MEKNVFLSSLLLVAGLSSCKQDYTCKCFDPYISAGGNPKFTVIHNSKKKATAQCEATSSGHNKSCSLLGSQ